MHTFIIVPSGFGVGLTSISLGLYRALARTGLKVGFCKPVAQSATDESTQEHSCELIARTHGICPPTPLGLAQFERMLGEGQGNELLEQAVQLCQQASEDMDVLLVEGMVSSPTANYAVQANVHLAIGLDAEVILVYTPEAESLDELGDRIDIHARTFGGATDPKMLGVIFNKVRDPNFTQRLQQHSTLFKDGKLRLLGCIPWQDELNALRTSDIATQLQARIINEGKLRYRRVQHIGLFSRAVHNSVELLKPGVLVVTPGDRNDIILAACLAAMNGVPLAGLLLTGNCPPDPRIMQLCHRALSAGLPVLAVDSGSYDTAHNLHKLNREISLDDHERTEKVTEFVASHLDHAWLHAHCGSPRRQRLSPPAFRYRLVQRAQAANRRIVLPEGSEPRTVQAAVICQNRGIARCVLLAKPEAVQAVAQALDIQLPPGLEIIDPEQARKQYVAPMVALRKNKGLNAPMAKAQLEDSVVLGTMMLAQGEVDGLVSGAIHTTANTIRPALQLIKTAPGCKLVSSVFFMLLPDQVVVYGDCAVNPEPDAAELADIALQSAASAAAFGIEPRVAMISYSTGNSGGGSEVDKVREATRLARAMNPQLLIDGPLQYDAAAIESVGQQKAPGSPVAGRATVFVFPDLNTGNTTYKAVQRSAGVLSVGPMLQGLRKPVNDLSRGASVDDIVYTIALTAVQGDVAPESSLTTSATGAHA